MHVDAKTNRENTSLLVAPGVEYSPIDQAALVVAVALCGRQRRPAVAGLEDAVLEARVGRHDAVLLAVRCEEIEPCLIG